MCEREFRFHKYSRRKLKKGHLNSKVFLSFNMFIDQERQISMAFILFYVKPCEMYDSPVVLFAGSDSADKLSLQAQPSAKRAAAGSGEPLARPRRDSQSQVSGRSTIKSSAQNSASALLKTSTNRSVESRSILRPGVNLCWAE